MLDIFTLVYRVQTEEAQRQVEELNRTVDVTNRNMQDTANQGSGLGDMMGDAFKVLGETVNRIAPGLGGAFNAAGSGANRLLETMRKIQEARARNNLNSNNPNVPPGGEPPPLPPTPPLPPGGGPLPNLPVPPVPIPVGGAALLPVMGLLAASAAVVAAFVAVAKSVNEAGVAFSRERYGDIAPKAREAGLSQQELLGSQMRGRGMNITNEEMQESMTGLKEKATEVIMNPLSGMSRGWNRHGVRPGNIRGDIKSPDDLLFNQVIPTMKKMEALKGTAYATELGVQAFGLSLGAATKILANSKDAVKLGAVEQNMAMDAEIKRKNAMQELTKAELETAQATAKLSASMATEVVPAAASAERAWARMVNEVEDAGWLAKAGSAWSNFIEGVYNSVTDLVKFIRNPLGASKSNMDEMQLMDSARRKDREWQLKTDPSKAGSDWGPEGTVHYDAYMKDRKVREVLAEKKREDAKKEEAKEKAVIIATKEKEDFGPMTKEKLIGGGLNEGQATFLTATQKGQEEVSKAMEKFGKDGFGKEQMFESLKQSKIMEQQLKVQWEIRNNTLPTLGMSIEQVLSQMSATLGKANDLRGNENFRSPTLQQSFGKVTEVAMYQRDNPNKLAMNADEISKLSKIKMSDAEAAKASARYFPKEKRADPVTPAVKEKAADPVTPVVHVVKEKMADLMTPVVKEKMADPMTPVVHAAKEKLVIADTMANSATAIDNSNKSEKGGGTVNSGNTTNINVNVAKTDAKAEDISEAVRGAIRENDTKQNRRLVQDSTSNISH